MQEKSLCIGIAVLSFLATLIAFLPALGSQYLLDEQFIAAWTKALIAGSAAGGWGNYFAWNGPSAQDAFGPLASLTCVFLSQSGAGLAKLASMIIHAGCSVALYLVARKLTGISSLTAGTWRSSIVSILISAFAAIIFAVHPLSAELVNFIGASGIELSILFFALSFNCYLSAHPIVKAGPESKAKLNSILAIVFFVCSYLAYTKSWYLIKIVAMFELLNFALDTQARDQYKTLWKDTATFGRKRFFITLGTLFLVSITLMALEIFRGTDPIGSLLAMFPDGIRSMLLTLMFPINRTLWKKYSLEYVILYIIFGLAAALSAYGLFKLPKYRVAVLTAAAWVFFGLMIGGNQSVVGDDFNGHRYLAHAQAGMALLIPILCFGLASALNEKRLWAAAPAVAVCLTFIIVSCRHSFAQTQSYKGASRLLQKIQKSAKIVCAKEKSAYCLAKDLPRSVAFTPIISPYRPVVLDALNGLLRAPTVSGGPLKDSLAAGKFLGSTTRWDGTFSSLVQIEVDPKTNNPPFVLNAKELGSSLNPPLQFWKTVSLDEKQNILKITSNSEHEPGISLFSRVLSPLDGDAFYVDAKITTPVEPSNPNVELHWMTMQTGQYEKEDRRAIARAKMNDNEFHRYYLSLRSTGWAANGPITQMMIGFPSSATVEVKEVGIVKQGTETEAGKSLFAKLKFAENIDATHEESANAHLPNRFADLCFNYPDSAELGLYHIDKNQSEVNLNYDISAITGGAKAILFSSPKNQFRLQTEGGEIPESVAFKQELSGTSGNLRLGLDKFEKTGIYGIRIAAVDAEGKPVGNFSDRIWLLVDKGQ